MLSHKPDREPGRGSSGRGRESAGASVWGQIPWEGNISVGLGWLGRILQAEKDGNVDSRQSKSASSWWGQQPVCGTRLRVGVFGEAMRLGS